MKKDIEFKPVEGIFLTIVKEDDSELWKVYLLNRSSDKIETVMITSKGYGTNEGEKQETSILRHSIPYVDAGDYALIEPINENVFHLTNEYWVSFFIEGQIFDKKYIFMPETIKEKNLSFIQELQQKGVLHS